jgi:Tfp pilus assembly protein PilX
MKAQKNRQNGFAMAAGVLILLLLSGLSVAVLNIYSSQITAEYLERQGTFALQAAQARAALVRAQLSQNVAFTPALGTEPKGCTVMGLPNTQLMTALDAGVGDVATGAELKYFQTTIRAADCVAGQYNDGNTPVDIYTVTITACNKTSGSCDPTAMPPDGNYVERQLTISVVRGL